MSDEVTNSPSSPEPKPSTRIKIGSQRDEAAEVNPSAEAIPADTAPTETPLGQSSRPEAQPESAGLEPTTPNAEVGALSSESVAEVDVASVAVEEREEVAGPVPIDFSSSEEDLEREIAAAMGEVGVEDLLAWEVKSRPDEVEIEIDGRYPATVIKTYRDSVLFELPSRRNGVVPLKQFEEPPEPGATLEVIVTGFSADDQLYELIVPGGSVQVADWSDLVEGVVVEAKITGHNKGGLECEVNHIRGFIPASQVSLYRVEDFSSYVDEKLLCVVTECKPERRNLVLSHRAVLEREKEEAREKLLAELEVGQTREGVVTRLQKFGAFVDLGGVDGLIPISQLSWEHIRHPSEVVEEGQHVKVRIERMDPQTGKIGLSYRDLMHHPWEGIESKYPIGGVVKGTVSKLMDFGAFVKLEPGVEGLVHISELSHKRVARVSHVVEEGQEVEVKVLMIDPEGQKISLSIKAAQAAADSPGDETSDAQDSAEESPRHQPKIPAKSLKGGISRSSGGEQFGLKW